MVDGSSGDAVEQSMAQSGAAVINHHDMPSDD
jgi:hypothetical protein